jgi:UDP-2,3-diacylglucosamine pyrophosphatase LpxH
MKKPNKKNNLGDRFHKSVCDVANATGKEPALVSKADYFTSDLKTTLSEWELRKAGGFSKLMNLYFPPDKNIVIDSASKMVRGYKNKLEAQYGREIFLKDEFISVFREVMEKNPIAIHGPVLIKKKSSKIERSLVVHFSDTHFGCNIEKSELNGINEYNWTIAARRTAFLIDQVVTYKPQYRDTTELVMLINGDIIAGVIHDQEWAVDLLTTQFAGAINIFSQAISYVAQHFRKVRVVCTPGNHGRAMHKSSKDRAMTHKWDSYENMVYLALKEIFGKAGKYNNVEFVIPESPYAIIEIQGHKFLVTHGDTVINVGNPGKNLNMKSINEQINKVNSQLIRGDENFAGIVVGHVHVSTIQETESGTMLLINGTMSGLDAYAQSLGIFSKNATQTLFEVVHGHPVGDIRLIRLREADSRPDLDGIIKPFKGKM